MIIEGRSVSEDEIQRMREFWAAIQNGEAKTFRFMPCRQDNAFPCGWDERDAIV